MPPAGQYMTIYEGPRQKRFCFKDFIRVSAFMDSEYMVVITQAYMYMACN